MLTPTVTEKEIENVKIATFNDGADNLPMALTVGIEPVQSGTGDPSPSNVRPISGWTGANVTRTGKNLISCDWNNQTSSSKNVDFTYTGNHLTASGTANGTNTDTSNIPLTHEILLKADVNYVMTLDGITASPSGMVMFLRKDNANVRYFEDASVSNKAVFNITVDKDIAIDAIKFRFYTQNGIAVSVNGYWYLEVGTASSGYDEYNANKYDITFPSQAGTVYGGTLTVNKDGTGALAVTHGIFDMGEASWTFAYSNRVFRTVSPIDSKGIIAYGRDGICSCYKNAKGKSMEAFVASDNEFFINNQGYSATPYIIVRDTSVSDEASFKTKMNGQTLIYELATPVTYSLTPGQVKNLLGVNNIWADTGDIIKLIYKSQVSISEYNDALAKEEYTHARVTFIVDNVVFQDEELEQGGIQLSTYMNPGENMKFGIAYCTEAVIHFLQSEKTDTVNFSHEFMLELGVEINGDISWVTVGRFFGSKPVQDITSNIVELVAYDKMIRFDRSIDDLLARIAFPCTLADIYDSLCELVVVDKTSGDEIADVMSRQIANANDWEFNTCREALAAIAEANGCYAKITNDGKLKFIWFEDHTSDQTLVLDNCFDGTIIKLEKSYSKKWGFLADRKWKDVEVVQYMEYDNMNNPFEYSYIHYLWKEVINEQNNRDVMQPTYDPSGNYKLWANVENYQWKNVESIKWKELEIADDIAGNIYVINNNPFILYSTDAEIKTHLQHILDRLALFHLYYVASVTMTGNWLIEPGDTVMLEVMKNTFVEYPIFNRVLKWNGSCQCDYETTGSL